MKTIGRSDAGGSGFVPPPYPYARLGEVLRRAEEKWGGAPGGLVDCSVGTPFDPPPGVVLDALARADNLRGYPPSNGSSPLRQSAVAWMARRFGVSLDPETQVAACVGTKEFVASLAQYLRLRTPERDTVLFPSVSYPTYAMGASLGGCRVVPVPAPAGGGLDLDAISPGDVERALVLWANSPANPTGTLTDLDTVAEWGRSHGIPVFSDECYTEFTWEGPPRSILQAGIEGVVAVHSLSKRSNLAGARVGFFAGDPELVGYLLDVRRHAGLMVPGPIQLAAAAALDDDAHVELQRSRYRERLEMVGSMLYRCGLPSSPPQGGFYHWVPVPGSVVDADWGLTRYLADFGGMLVSPGEFYGPDGGRFVRIAVVQPTNLLALVAERLEQAPRVGLE